MLSSSRIVTKQQKREREIIELYKKGALSQSECARLLKMSVVTFQKKYKEEVQEVKKLRAEKKIPSSQGRVCIREGLVLESYKNGYLSQSDCCFILGMTLGTFAVHYRDVIEEHNRLREERKKR